MEIRYRKNKDSLTVYLDGELDECSSSNVKVILDKLLYDNLGLSKIVFDLADVSFMDSTGVGLLMGRYKLLNKFNIPLYISSASIPADRVLSLSGLYSIMPKI